MLQSIIYDRKTFILQGTGLQKRCFLSINEPLTSLRQLSSMQNVQNPNQCLFRPLMNFSAKKKMKALFQFLWNFVSFCFDHDLNLFVAWHKILQFPALNTKPQFGKCKLERWALSRECSGCLNGTWFEYSTHVFLQLIFLIRKVFG